MPRPRLKKAPSYLSRDGLQMRRMAFILEYLRNGRNATQAALKTCNVSTTLGAKQAGYLLLRQQEVQAAIKAHDEEQTAIVGLTTNRTLREIARIAYADPIKAFNEDGTLKPLHEMDADIRSAIASIEVETRTTGSGKTTTRITTKKLKLWDKNAALDKAMRYQGLFSKDNEQRHDIVQTLILDANRALDGKFARLLGSTAKASEAASDS